MHHRAILGVVLPGLVLLAGCHDPTDHEKQRVIGVLDLVGANPPAIVAPPEVAAGRRFTVTVYTWGNSDCTLADGGSMTVSGELVRLVPYDIIPIPGHSDVCRDDWTAHAHPFGITLTLPGTARLRVVGRRAARAEDSLDSLEVTVAVTP
ncbi:MAG TPA: hypothetical protein VEB59_10660 [Gemmatimonadales bacterium]|nr:hypothetical protein [Gemmatimonadales bacterium]